MVTRTINQLHFEDLDPIRFEELILSIVYRMKKWHKLDHFGKKGSDAGIDIRAIEMLENGEEYTYFFQCKRYEKMNKSIIKKIVDDYLMNNSTVPNKYILVVSCVLTRSQIEYFEQYCKDNKFNFVNVWTGTIIESMLYFQYPDLLYVYFGLNLISDDWKIKSKRYDCLKLYLDSLNANLKEFEYTGELAQTFFCLRAVFILSLDRMKYIKDLHKNNDYLFEEESNILIYSIIEEIDKMISKFVNEFFNADIDRQLEVAEWMDNISIKIYNFENEYIRIIKLQMSNILLGK